MEESLVAGLGVLEDNKEKYQNLKWRTDLAYKLFYRQNGKTTLETFDERNDILDVISSQLMWTMPLENTFGEIVATATFKKSNGSFQLLYYGEYVEEEFSMMTNVKLALEVLNKAAEDKALTDIKAFHLADLYLSGYYLVLDNEAYIYPFQVIEPITPSIETNRLYTVDEFMETIRKDSVIDIKYASDGSVLYSGASQNTASGGISDFTLVLIGLLLGGTAAIVIPFFLKRRKYTKSGV